MANATEGHNLSTQEIQQYLHENNMLILRILGVEKLETGCSREQYINKLARNLKVLAEMAEAHLQRALEEDAYLKRAYQQAQQCLQLDQTTASDPGSSQMTIVNEAHSSQQQAYSGMEQQVDSETVHEEQGIPFNEMQPGTSMSSSGRTQNAAEMKFIKFL